MMKRFTRLALACVIVLMMVTMAAAQTAPTPVTRIGDWVEIGNETFMNIIANSDIRYFVVHNMEFEGDVRDVPTSRNPTSSSNCRTSSRRGASTQMQSMRRSRRHGWRTTRPGMRSPTYSRSRAVSK